MKFWQMVTLAETEQLIDLARFAEELGFEGVMTSDHVFSPYIISSSYPYSPDGKAPIGTISEFPDPWVATAAMVAATTRLKFSCYVYILPLRHPIEVAKATSTLAVMSQNRFMLGAGVGWMQEEFDTLGVDFASRGRRMDEMIEILGKLWTGGWVEHQGDFFQLERLAISPAPGSAIPIYLGAGSQSAFRRVARVADGWLAPPGTLEQFSKLLAQLNELRREAGRDSAPFEVFSPAASPDYDSFARLRDSGCTSGLHLAGAITGKLPPRSSLDDKKRHMELFARSVVARLAS